MGKLVRAPNTVDLLHRLFFSAWCIPENLSRQNQDLYRIGISRCEPLDYVKRSMMLFLEKKTHCEVARCLIMARCDD
ncbi:hypothetical protein CJO88_19040 (plasmid) [Ralstonia solanacearum]|nr:hypothetical protein LBM341_03722 [Ralstonia solanacearum]APF89740.1 hypothetical protein BCR16_23430 [Ralstonia solanacearum FJAT-1458]AXW35460.1 hypothetical protein CJO88_19040 [Ralstonia solanacearum]AXW60103.1 hypothetical protein CJO93_22820 [Ralstonia solanacearum]NKA15604.1 hypothetical protein [Ralstonia solanacearum]